MQNTETYRISDSIEIHDVIAEIENNFSVKREASRHLTQAFLDTFDWRLYHKGLSLIEEGNDYLLVSIATEAIIQKLTRKLNHQPEFWWDFPDGSFKNELKKYLDVRALMPLFTIKKNVTRLRVLNEDEKTILRLCLEHNHLLDNQNESQDFNLIKLVALRGYQNDFQRVKSHLIANELVKEPIVIYSRALKELGKKPGDYSSKLNIQLEPNMSGRQAIKIILKFLLQVIKKNIDGMRADIDTEFLHDFRVAIRRIRSALTQIKGVLPNKITTSFKQDVTAPGKSTNRMRDIDVYLLKKSHYRQMLPENLRPGLDPLFRKLAEQRIKEHRNLVKMLESGAFQKMLARWDKFLSSDNENEATKNSHKPVLELAKKNISQKYNHVVELGSKINDDSPDSDLHRLRIECKKLRYVLEFFASLFPPGQISILIKQLKKLQDNLGDFNDLSLQQENLKAFLGDMTPQEDHSLMAAASIGGLVSALYQQQLSARNAFADTFTEFSSPKNIELYQRLFNKTTKGA